MVLLPKQEHAVFYLNDKKTKEILYGGAAGGGKTALGCLWLISMCQRFPKSRWLMGRAKLKALKDTTLKTFFDLASDLKITEEFTYNAQSNIIYFNNGSEIILKDLFLYPSDPSFDSLGSLEITGAFIDECNQVVYKAWQIVTSRCRYKLNEFGLIPKVLGSCNPAKNWTYKNFYKANADGNIPEYRKFIQALPTDNPHLPQSYLDSLLTLDLNSKERLYFGNWEFDNDPSTLIDINSIYDYFKPIHIERTGEMFLTIDVARKGKDKTIFRVWDGFLCIHRFEILKSGLDVVVRKAKDLMRKYKIPLTHVVADEDGVGGGLVDWLQCLGFINGSRPKKEMIGNDYVVPNYANLKTQCGYKIAEMIVSRKLGEVCDDSEVIRCVGEEMEQVKQKDIDKDGKITLIGKEVVKQYIGRSPDEWDSIMMRYFFELEPKVFFF